MAERILGTVLSLSLSGTCLTALGVVLVHWLGGRLSPGLRRLMWALILVRLLCPWSPPGGLLDLEAAELGQVAVSAEPLEQEGISVETEQKSNKEKMAAAGLGDGLPAGEALCLIWAAGFGISLVRRGVAYRRMVMALGPTLRPAAADTEELYGLLTAGCTRPPRLWVSAAVPCPMAVGLFRPAIVLPELEFSRQELGGVLAHELAHWRQGDLWLKQLSALAVSVHWFNPAVRYLAGRLDRDCELVCDRAAVRGLDEAGRLRYGALLLRLAAGEGSPSAALFSQKRRLEERLKAVKEFKKYGRKAVALGAAVCLTLAVTSTALGSYTGPEAVEEGLAELSGGETATPEMLSWPLEVGDSIEVSTLFTGRVHPITGERHEHRGIDIPRPEGTAVLAAADGTVLEAGFTPQEGNYVLLEHGELTTKYTHLKECSAGVGEKVSVGEQIGQVGRTGMATGSHLHFETEAAGVLVDPLTLLDEGVTVLVGSVGQ